MFIGNGWDLHKHSASKPMYLAGLEFDEEGFEGYSDCLLYTSPSPRDQRGSRMPSSA